MSRKRGNELEVDIKSIYVSKEYKKYCWVVNTHSVLWLLYIIIDHRLIGVRCFNLICDYSFKKTILNLSYYEYTITLSIWLKNFATQKYL